MSDLPHTWRDIRRDWPLLTLHQRFETTVAAVLTVVIAAVIVVALGRLMVSVVELLVLRSLNPLDHVVFQHVFGEIMTLLIALEFNHTLRFSGGGALGIIQVRTVILIALLALARKVIIVDLHATPPAVIAALAALGLSLGVTCWLLALPGRRPERVKVSPRGTAPADHAAAQRNG